MKPPWRRNVVRVLPLAAVLAAWSCGERATPTGPRSITPGESSRSISDGAHGGGNDDVWFLPPMVSDPTGKPGYGDAFAPGLPVVISVVDVTQNNKVLVGVTATTESVTDQLYQANWDTKNTSDNNPLTDQYLIQVTIGTKIVASADANLVSNGSQVKNSSGDIVTLPDGRTLPIKVRIEQGWDCKNNSSCMSQVVPATIPTGTAVTVKTNDGKDWITFYGGDGSWNSANVPVVVTVEDVSSQLGGTAQGCAQGYTRMVVDGHCMRITTDPQITLTRPATVCMTIQSYDDAWQMLKYGAGETPKFLGDPSAGACPSSAPVIGSATPSRNPFVRLAVQFGSALRRLVTPSVAYAFDLGVGGQLSSGDGFSYFAPGQQAQMQVYAGNGQSATVGTVLPIAPAVLIKNTHHNTTISGAIVTCTITSGGGTLSLASGQATEAPAGVYTCPNWTLGATAGTNTLKVTANIIDTTAAGGTITFTETGSTCGASLCIVSVTPSSTNVVLDGTSVSYAAVLQNPTASSQQTVVLQGYLIQGTNNRAAGGTDVSCPPAALGALPPGNCTMNWVIAASNANAGSGTLVPGSASFVLQLILNGNVADADTVPVTLAALPNPALALKNFDPEQGATTYNLTVTNRSVYPDAMFAASPNLPACGLNTSASRTWVDIYDGVTHAYIYGFCSFSSAADLDLIWFSVPSSATPPASVYIVMTDRLTNTTYTSNTISLDVTPVLALKSVEAVTGTTSGTRYNLTVTNRSIYSNQFFAQIAPGCSDTQSTSSRTWVNIFDQTNAYVYGFCQLQASSDLDGIWFFVPTGGTKPSSVYIQLQDRLLTHNYQSNSIAIP